MFSQHILSVWGMGWLFVFAGFRSVGFYARRELVGHHGGYPNWYLWEWAHCTPFKVGYDAGFVALLWPLLALDLAATLPGLAASAVRRAALRRATRRAALEDERRRVLAASEKDLVDAELKKDLVKK